MSVNGQRPTRRGHRLSTVVVRPEDLVYTPSEQGREESCNEGNTKNESYLSRINCSVFSEKRYDCPELRNSSCNSNPTDRTLSNFKFIDKATATHGNSSIVSAEMSSTDEVVDMLGRRNTDGLKGYIKDYNISHEVRVQGDNPVSHNAMQGAIGERTNNFKELLDAFKTLEKRPNEEVASRVLKKFRTNDECLEERTVSVVLDVGVFPQIKNNPFVKWDSGVRIDPLCEEQATPQRVQRRSRRHSISKASALHWER